MRIFNLPLLACLALAPSLVAAQPIHEKQVSFPARGSGTTLQGKITGAEITDYVLGAGAGQTMTIDFASSNPSAYFNLMQGSDPAAIHVGSSAGNHFKGVLPVNGNYRIRVFLMRNAARRGETADYKLSVSIGGTKASAPANADFADGLSGGPDWWQVSGVSANDALNVRSGPGTAHGVIGELANGDRIRNRGCKMTGETRWCHVETAGDQPFSGWVAGRFLKEAAAPSGNSKAAGHEARGNIPCAQSAGQPMGNCEFRVSRGNGGTASVWIALPSGGERYLDFRDGRLVGSDPGMSVSHTREQDLNMILVNGAERYEIPDAALFGG